MHGLCKLAFLACRADLEFLQKNVDPKVLERLQHVAGTAFTRITYTKAVEILTDAIRTKKKKFENSKVRLLTLHFDIRRQHGVC